MQNYNSRNMYRNRNRRFNNSSVLHMHFENIQLLATIIQDSQRFNEPPQRNNTTDGVSNIVFQFDTLFQPLHQENSRNNDISYTIVKIEDESHIHLMDSSQNVHLYDVSSYSFINNPINDICPITRERFSPEQNVMMIAQCKHIFNKPNLNTWLRQNNTCPSCRALIRNNRSTSETTNPLIPHSL